MDESQIVHVAKLLFYRFLEITAPENGVKIIEVPKITFPAKDVKTENTQIVKGGNTFSTRPEYTDEGFDYNFPTYGRDPIDFIE